jgi:colanic acid biosynthesis glycosyl transferase WcaI
MNKEQTLFVSPFFEPEVISTGKYNGELVKALRASGMDILVATSFPIYPEWKPKPIEAVPGVIRGGGGVRYPKHPLLRRSVLEIWFAIFAAIQIWRLRPVRKLIVVCPPSLFAMLVVRMIPRNARCVAIVHDLQGVYAALKGDTVSNALSGLIRRVERFALRRCDAVIFLSRSMRDQAVADYGLPFERTNVCYPFPNIAKFAGTTRLAAKFPSGWIHVVYSGALGEKQNAEALIAGFRALLNLRQDVVCHIFSRGPCIDSLSAKKGVVDRLHFHDLVSDADLPELYSRSAIQVIPQKTGTSEASLPSKLPNLLAAGCPVFAITEPVGELAEVVSATGGYVHSNWAPESIAAGLSAFLEILRRGESQDQAAIADIYLRKHFSLDSLIGVIRSSLRS